MSLSRNEFRRGDIVRARFDPVEGSEQGGTRPALVVSPAIINNAGTVVLLAAITSRNLDRVYPFEALLEGGEGGLSRSSKVMLRHLRAMDKGRISGRLGSLSPEAMLQVDAALSVAVGLKKL